MNDETEMNARPEAQAAGEAAGRPETQSAGEAADRPEREAIEHELTGALSSTLDSLNRSIELMETIVHRLEAGEADWEESVRLLSEANDLAMDSSQKLDRVVQDVVYGSADDDAGEQDPIPGI